MNFEMPITLTFVKPGQLVCVLSIGFNKFDAEEKESAYQLHDELKQAFAQAGIGLYRHGILGMENLQYSNNGKMETFKQLKKALDPNNIISPGRYGI